MRCNIDAISTTAEPLFKENRILFQNVFNCEVYDQYGCGEVQSIAFECPEHTGLHVAFERCITEIDKNGNLIVTDLDNHAFPFIRYKNGDKVTESKRPCPCGRKGMKFSKILGRDGDVVIGPNNNSLHPEFFTHLLNESGVSFRNNIKKYQVIQEKKEILEWMIIGEECNEDDKIILKNAIRKYLGDIDVSIRNVKEIKASSSGKHRYVISNL